MKVYSHSQARQQLSEWRDFTKREEVLIFRKGDSIPDYNATKDDLRKPQ
jgi:hypothetical protein